MATAAKQRKIPALGYKIMIVVATLIWGLSFVVMKDTVAVLQPATLVGVRFLIASILLGLVFFKRVRAAFGRDAVVKGFILGTFLFLAYWFQTVGVANTTPGRNAFLTATYCVMVPFGWWIVAKIRPGSHNIVAALTCIIGVYLVTVGSDTGNEFGDIMTVIGAIWFAVHIIFVAKFSEGRDMIVLTVFQFLAMGIWGSILGLLTEAPPDLSAINFDFFTNMIYLIVFASCVALLFQNIAQAHVPPAQASLLLSLEAVFGVLFSVLLYGEQVSIRLIVGFVLIFVAIVVSELFPLINPLSKRGEQAS